VPYQIEGRASDNPDQRPSVDSRIVSPRYFETLGIPLLAGRVLSAGDGRDGPPVVVINRAMARYWETGDPIGSRVSFDAGRTYATVVGVVGDVRQFGLDRQPLAQVYRPLQQTRQNLQGLILVRTRGNPVDAAAFVREAVRAVDPNMPVENIRSLEDLRERYLSTPRLTALLLSLFAALALVVTMTGLTGVIAMSVSQRTQEFGVRMALGATRDRVLAMVLRQGLTVVVSGLAVGLVASIALTRVLSSYLYDTTPTDPTTVAAVAVALIVAGALACLGPAWRATRVDPMVALRVD
jgi:predicted permease